MEVSFGSQIPKPDMVQQNHNLKWHKLNLKLLYSICLINTQAHLSHFCISSIKFLDHKARHVQFSAVQTLLVSQVLSGLAAVMVLEQEWFLFLAQIHPDKEQLYIWAIRKQHVVLSLCFPPLGMPRLLLCSLSKCLTKTTRDKLLQKGARDNRGTLQNMEGRQ